MTIDVNKLRSLTQEAIDEKTRQTDLKHQEKLRQEQIERETAQAEAQGVIIRVEQLVEIAAREGKSHANVLRLDYKDYDSHSYRSGVISRANLKHKAMLVYDFLQKNELSPSLEYDHDGVGRESWYMLRANW